MAATGWRCILFLTFGAGVFSVQLSLLLGGSKGSKQAILINLKNTFLGFCYFFFKLPLFCVSLKYAFTNENSFYGQSGELIRGSFRETGILLRIWVGLVDCRGGWRLDLCATKQNKPTPNHNRQSTVYLGFGSCRMNRTVPTCADRQFLEKQMLPDRQSSMCVSAEIVPRACDCFLCLYGAAVGGFVIISAKIAGEKN